MDSIATRIFQLIAHNFGCDPAGISRATTASDVAGWDSLSHAVLLVTVEHEFAIRLNLEQIFDVDDVGGLIDIVTATAHPTPSTAG
ncbi:MAG: acyl carrier protein [Proteobacteria bacterium]|nr:acyl carrier protein [Pseudomonadota bacterium]